MIEPTLLRRHLARLALLAVAAACTTSSEAPRRADPAQPEPAADLATEHSSAQAAAAPSLLDVLPRADAALPPAPEGARWVEEHFADGRRRSARTVIKDEDGILNHGPYLRWFENGFLAEQGEYVRGERHGAHRTYYETGLRLAETEYDHGVQHGVLRRYDPMNKLIQQSHFVRGKREGAEELWWDSEHRRATTYWKNDLPDGPWTQWHFSGPASESGRYEAGARVGEWVYRSESDVVLRVENYLGGRLHGAYLEFDEQGLKLREGRYVDGVAHGEQLEFHPGAAQAKSRIEYAGGRPNGAARSWYPDGTRESEGELRDGQREGRWTYWNSDGTLHSKLSGLYRSGERVGD